MSVYTLMRVASVGMYHVQYVQILPTFMYCGTSKEEGLPR